MFTTEERRENFELNKEIEQEEMDELCISFDELTINKVFCKGEFAIHMFGIIQKELEKINKGFDEKCQKENKKKK